METEKKAVKKTVWGWTFLGALSGWIAAQIVAGVLFLPPLIALGVGIICTVVLGRMAYRSSAKNGGKAPSWLWLRWSRKKD